MVRAQAVTHAFVCDALGGIRDGLTLRDLWDRPREALAFLGRYRQMSR